MAGRDYARAQGLWHNVTATTRAAVPSHAAVPGNRLNGPAGPHPAGCRSHRHSWEKTTPVAVKIKLKRLGKIHAPYYRVVVANARAKRDGRAIEEIGAYQPMAEPSFIEIDSERAQYWLSVGAQPTGPVRALLKITGDWQRFRGEEGAEGTLKAAPPGRDKKDAFAAALKESHGDAGGAATTTRARGRRPDQKADRPDARTQRPARTGQEKTGRADDSAAAVAAAQPAQAAPPAAAQPPAGGPGQEAQHDGAGAAGTAGSAAAAADEAGSGA